MAYRSSRKVLNIKWPPGHRLHELHIQARSCSIDKLLELGRLSAAVQAGRAGGAIPIDALRSLLDTFGESIVSWDLLDDDGNDVPPGRAGLEFLDLEDVIDVVTAWAREITQVPDPLGTRSIPSGPPIPMEAIPGDLSS